MLITSSIAATSSAQSPFADDISREPFGPVSRSWMTTRPCSPPPLRVIVAVKSNDAFESNGSYPRVAETASRTSLSSGHDEISPREYTSWAVRFSAFAGRATTIATITIAAQRSDLPAVRIAELTRSGMTRVETRASARVRAEARRETHEDRKASRLPLTPIRRRLARLDRLCRFFDG
jgi:hypothetical protein